MLTFGQRKPYLSSGYQLLIGACIFGGSFSKSNAIFAVGVIFALCIFADLVVSLKRPPLTLQVGTEPWLEVGVPSPVTLSIEQPEGQQLVLHGTALTQFGSLAFCRGPAHGINTLTVGGRGLLTVLDLVTLNANGPIGIAGMKHEAKFGLPVAVPVGPAAEPHPEIDVFIDQLEDALAEPAVLGVRPYAPGDRRSDVHWRSTARTGDLMVRERLRVDPEINRPVVISVLTENPAVLETGLAYARHAATRCIALGFETRLELAFRNGSSSAGRRGRTALTDVTTVVAETVATDLEVMHALARAVPTTLTSRPRPPGAAMIRIDRGVTCSAHG